MNEETDPYHQVIEYQRMIKNQQIEYQNSIDISYKNITPPEWMKDIWNFCQILLKNLGIKNREVSLLFCDDTFIRELNKKYRAINSATDVLAFPQEVSPGNKNFPCNEKELIKGGQPGKICAGDIVISLPALMRNANNYHVHKEEELKRLIIHGVLHLTGMDHNEDGCDMCDMLILQEKLLKDLKGG